MRSILNRPNDSAKWFGPASCMTKKSFTPAARNSAMRLSTSSRLGWDGMCTHQELGSSRDFCVTLSFASRARAAMRVALSRGSAAKRRQDSAAPFAAVPAAAADPLLAAAAGPSGWAGAGAAASGGTASPGGPACTITIFCGSS
jgi:hypothetical protein